MLRLQLPVPSDSFYMLCARNYAQVLLDAMSPTDETKAIIANRILKHKMRKRNGTAYLCF